jgi:hypothetical protein
VVSRIACRRDGSAGFARPALNSCTTCGDTTSEHAAERSSPSLRDDRFGVEAFSSRSCVSVARGRGGATLGDRAALFRRNPRPGAMPRRVFAYIGARNPPAGNEMNLSITNRRAMVVAGLAQGALLLSLHEWFRAFGHQASDLAWSAPAYALVVLAPVTFSFLKDEFPLRRSLAGAAVATLPFMATAAWFGWSSVSILDEKRSFAPSLPDFLVFCLASLVAWFVLLPFVQSRLRDGGMAFRYPRLFDDAWRNALLLANCILFAALFWMLLGLWAGLFLVLKMEFFKDLFTSRSFVYLATAVAIGFAISLEEKEAGALRTLRRHLLAFQTRLLPLAALIVVLFLGALPIAGLAPVWATGHATPLILSMLAILVCLANAAWQDGAQPPPFSLPAQWLARAALALSPVLAGLCIWSLSLRIAQHGWSVDRVWAALLVTFAALYALGYAACAVTRGWLRPLGAVNTWLALLMIGTLLAVHTPLLDPAAISAGSQVRRLLSGATTPERFDFDHLRFDLGRAGGEALQALAGLDDHPQAGIIREKARDALARKTRYAGQQQAIPDAAAIRARLQPYPTGSDVPGAFVAFLAERLASRDMSGGWQLAALTTGRTVPLLAIDLGMGAEPELVLMAYPFPAFARVDGRWRQIGAFDFARTPRPEEITALLERGDVGAAARVWSDLRLGDRKSVFTPQTDRSGD